MQINQAISLLVYVTRDGIYSFLLFRILIRRASLNLTTKSSRLASRMVFGVFSSRSVTSLFSLPCLRNHARTRSTPEWLTTSREEKSGDSRLTSSPRNWSESWRKPVVPVWKEITKFYRWSPPPCILPHPRPRLFFDQSHPTSVTFRPSVLEACLIKQISSPFDALPLKSN